MASNFKESLSYQSHFIYILLEISQLVFLVYVDDIILTSSSNEFIEFVIQRLGTKFAIKDLGQPMYFLGIHITPLQNGDLFISQHQYLTNLLHGLNLENLKLTDDCTKFRQTINI